MLGHRCDSVRMESLDTQQQLEKLIADYARPYQDLKLIKQMVLLIIIV